ncbi:MAG: ATP-binding protein [Clostridiaceae bacterium]
MKNQCNSEQEDILNKLIGLGDTSVHKNYYSILQEKIRSLEETERQLEWKVKERTKQYEELNEELKQKIAELETTQQELSQVIERLRETQTELVHSEKMASIGTLVAGVAHEINNPVNYAYLSSTILKKDLYDFKEELLYMMDGIDDEVINFFDMYFEKFSNSINNVMEGSNQVKTIVKDLRLFSRLDEAVKKEISVSEALETTIRLVKTQYTKHIEFTAEFQSEGKIECYPSQLDQVFLNIIVNACQAIIKKQSDLKDETMGLVKISLLSNEKGILISFSDNGCGMTEEVKSKMFEPFFTTKPTGQGTGLGMSISYGIIEKHNGNIEVKSQVGQGSVITVFLPNEINSAR